MVVLLSDQDLARPLECHVRISTRFSITYFLKYITSFLKYSLWVAGWFSSAPKTRRAPLSYFEDGWEDAAAGEVEPLNPLSLSCNSKSWTRNSGTRNPENVYPEPETWEDAAGAGEDCTLFPKTLSPEPKTQNPKPIPPLTSFPPYALLPEPLNP